MNNCARRNLRTLQRSLEILETGSIVQLQHGPAPLVCELLLPSSRWCFGFSKQLEQLHVVPLLQPQQIASSI